MKKMTEKMKEWMKEITMFEKYVSLKEKNQILFVFSVLAIYMNHVKMMQRTYPFYLAQLWREAILD